jgi:hypothetical protein
MVRAAGEGEVVHVGGAAIGVLVDMVDFAEVTGYVAAGCCTPTVLGVNVEVMHPR